MVNSLISAPNCKVHQLWGHISIVGNPIILLHGILGQKHLYWNLFKLRLREDDFRYHECILPYAMLGDIRIAAGILKDKVDATLRGDKATKVDLVCHSAGGLVARYYMMYLGGDKKIGHLVTMGSPHQGTYFSYILGVNNILQVAKQTRPGSNFLDEINGPGAVPNHISFTNLWSPLDTIVLPSSNSKLPGSHAIKIPLCSHWGFLVRKDVYGYVRDALLDRLPKPQAISAA